MTGDSSGTINSANLNGTGATQLASIRAVPMGIAVDTARSKLFWTNARGRVQSANLDGSGITNVVSGLGSPSELVLSNSISAPAATPQRRLRRPPLISTMSMETDRSITPIVMQSQSQSQPGQPMPSTMSTETARLMSLTS